MFERIQGQDSTLEVLKRAVKLEKIAQSYLFYGPEGVGKFTSALYFGMAVNCLSELGEKPCGKCSSCVKLLQFSHPDFLYLFPTPNYDMSPEGEIKDNKMLREYESFLENKREKPWKEYFFSGNIGLRLDSVRMLQHRINLSRNEAKYKIFIIERAEMMNMSSANAFLKTLEEPPDDVMIILISAKPESLLPTIISRCQKVSFQKLSRQVIEKELLDNRGCELIIAKTIARIADGNMEKALCLIEEQKTESRQSVLTLISLIVNGDDLGFMSYIEKYKTLKNVSELIDVIRNLVIWLTDVACFYTCPDEIVNIDRLELIEQIAATNSLIEEQITEIIRFLETMIKRLEGNVNPHLVGIEIYLQLKQYMKPVGN
ncbi:MAG: DNA polymerase III subunit delta' [Candidatus Cloacimonetes bacterium]|nr:DNA polymerase III subunit delta' [Candidatus Cloacimonadota bacterium]